MASSVSISRPALAVAAAGPALALALAACSPTFNWRDSPIDAQLTALLPCKPDRAERQLPLTADGKGPQATIVMAGCEAGGATFAVAHWPALSAEEASERLKTWQAATRAQWGGAKEQASAAAVARAAASPAPEQWLIERPEGQAGQIRWFAKADAQGRVTLYQAIVLGKPPAGEAVATFFDGLRLR